MIFKIISRISDFANRFLWNFLFERQQGASAATKLNTMVSALAETIRLLGSGSISFGNARIRSFGGLLGSDIARRVLSLFWAYIPQIAIAIIMNDAAERKRLKQAKRTRVDDKYRFPR